jgi:hypothetical protein
MLDFRDDQIEVIPDELPEQNPLLDQFNESCDAWFAPKTSGWIPDGVTEGGLPVQQLGLGLRPTIH